MPSYRVRGSCSGMRYSSRRHHKNASYGRNSTVRRGLEVSSPLGNEQPHCFYTASSCDYCLASWYDLMLISHHFAPEHASASPYVSYSRLVNPIIMSVSRSTRRRDGQRKSKLNALLSTSRQKWEDIQHILWYRSPPSGCTNRSRVRLHWWWRTDLLM